MIAGSPYDTSKGKLLLIDMKTAPPVVTQVNLELPTEIPSLKESEAAEKFGENRLNS